MVLNATEPTPELMEQVGRFVARMGTVLEGFDSPGAHRVHIWDLAHVLLAAKFVGCVDDAEVSKGRVSLRPG